MKRKLITVSSALALALAGFAAASPAEARGGSCAWKTVYTASKPARHTIEVTETGGGCSTSGGFGSKVYYYTNSNGGTEHSINSSQKVKQGQIQATAPSSTTFFSRGGAWS